MSHMLLTASMKSRKIFMRVFLREMHRKVYVAVKTYNRAVSNDESAAREEGFRKNRLVKSVT